MASIILIGPLADPRLRDALGLSHGQRVIVAGMLTGGRWSGIRAGGWPRLAPGEGRLDGVRVEDSAILRRYAAVMGLSAVSWHGETVLGVTDDAGPRPDQRTVLRRHPLL